jgi:hypothetical protein
MPETRRLVPLSVLLALLALTAEASADAPPHRVRFEASPDTVLLLDGETSDGSTFHPSNTKAEEASYVRACAGSCSFEAAEGTYTAWVVANQGQRIPDALKHSLPPISASEPQRLELSGPTSIASSYESHAGRRTAATVVLVVGVGAGLVMGAYGLGLDKPVFIGAGAGSIVVAYAGYYLLRKEDELTLSIAPLESASVSSLRATAVTDVTNVTDGYETPVARGAALTLSF